LLAAEGMVCLGVLSLDGTKLAGNASQKANKTLPQIEKLLAEAAAADAAEDAQHGSAAGPVSTCRQQLAQAGIEPKLRTVLADSGYVTEDNVAHADTDGLRLLAPLAKDPGRRYARTPQRPRNLDRLPAHRARRPADAPSPGPRRLQAPRAVLPQIGKCERNAQSQPGPRERSGMAKKRGPLARVHLA
jgi:hypothetical protein